MPLPDHRCLVAGRLQQLWKRLLVAVESVAIGLEAVEVAVLARLDHRSARTADRIGHVAAVESHSLVGDPIEIGRRDPRRIVGTEGLFAVIVREDEHDVGSAGRPRKSQH